MVPQSKVLIFLALCSITILLLLSNCADSQQLTATMPPRAPSCALNCPTGNDKICANNGVTYKNQCRFDCAKRRNRRLRLVKKGDCSSTTLNDYRRG